MQKPAQLFVPLALAFALPAQNPMGLLEGLGVSSPSRGGTAASRTDTSVVLLRIDREHYGGWGVDPANPGMRAIQGLRVVLQDELGSTAETFAVRFYGPDPVRPDTPDVSTSLGGLAGLAIPAGSASASAYDVSITFATPVLVPAGVDVYPAVELPPPAAPGWPSDGLSVHWLGFDSAAGSLFDLPGASHPTATLPGNAAVFVPNQGTSPAYTAIPGQWWMEPILAGPTGVAGTTTNQPWLVPSNVAPGTSSMASGLHPDAASPPRNAGRADDIAQRWFDAAAADGTAVLFFYDLAPLSGLEVPAVSLLSGSTGVGCLGLGTAELVGIGTTLRGEASLAIPIPAAARAIVGGLSVSHQAAALNAAGGLDFGICTRQVL